MSAPPLHTGPRDLSRANTFGLPARAARCAWLSESEQLPALADWLHAQGDCIALDHPLWLGGGSNIVFGSDPRAPVVGIGLMGRRILGHDTDNTCIVEAAAGESWDGFVRWTIEQKLGGLENLISIPGTCGAAPWQNIGAYGLEIADRLVSLDAWDWRTGLIRSLTPEECQFGYRVSRFRSDPGRWLITAIRVRLTHRAHQPVLRFGELARALAGQEPTPERVAATVAGLRRAKLPDPAITGNAGSFFRNPVVTAETATRLRDAFPAMPAHPQPDGQVKLSAGWLIEHSGLKGWRMGQAAVSEQHALVLVNLGGATGAEVIALARSVQERVAAHTGVWLEPEPVLIT